MRMPTGVIGCVRGHDDTQARINSFIVEGGRTGRYSFVFTPDGYIVRQVKNYFIGARRESSFRVL